MINGSAARPPGVRCSSAASTLSPSAPRKHSRNQPLTMSTLILVIASRPGQLIYLAGVPVPGQHRGGDVGDVVGVQERLAHVPGGQGDLPLKDRREQVTFAGVLAGPVAPQHGP